MFFQGRSTTYLFYRTQSSSSISLRQPYIFNHFMCFIFLVVNFHFLLFELFIRFGIIIFAGQLLHRRYELISSSLVYFSPICFKYVSLPNISLMMLPSSTSSRTMSARRSCIFSLCSTFVMLQVNTCPRACSWHDLLFITLSEPVKPICQIFVHKSELNIKRFHKTEILTYPFLSSFLSSLVTITPNLHFYFTLTQHLSTIITDTDGLVALSTPLLPLLFILLYEG